MVPQDTLFVLLVCTIDRIPTLPALYRPPRGHPKVYPDRLFLKALVIMIVRQVYTPSGLQAILAQPTAEMLTLRGHMTLVEERFPCQRTWERRLAAILSLLLAQITCFGRFLIAEFAMWLHVACAAAIDSTVLTVCGGVWHEKHREAGIVPHSSIDTDADWTNSGYHGWIYGWKLH
jgi:hypothetical protein